MREPSSQTMFRQSATTRKLYPGASPSSARLLMTRPVMETLKIKYFAILLKICLKSLPNQDGARDSASQEEETVHVSDDMISEVHVICVMSQEQLSRPRVVKSLTLRGSAP